MDIRLNETAAEAEFSFEGIGFAVNGEAVKSSEEIVDVDLEVEMTIDGEPVVKSILPTADRTRKPTPFWRYRLQPGRHSVRIKLLSPVPGVELNLSSVVVYAAPADLEQRHLPITGLPNIYHPPNHRDGAVSAR